MAARAETSNATRRIFSVTQQRAAICWPTGNRKMFDFEGVLRQRLPVSYARNRSDIDDSGHSVRVNLDKAQPAVRSLRLHPRIPTAQRIENRDGQDPHDVQEPKTPALARRYRNVRSRCESLRLRRAVTKQPGD